MRLFAHRIRRWPVGSGMIAIFLAMNATLVSLGSRRRLETRFAKGNPRKRSPSAARWSSHVPAVPSRTMSAWLGPPSLLHMSSIVLKATAS